MHGSPPAPAGEAAAAYGQGPALEPGRVHQQAGERVRGRARV
ncbi:MULTISPECIES: hypothetical protein [unclassified Streptomyces]|nr:hypothetical protein [Streptomyces sp. CB01373]